MERTQEHQGLRPRFGLPGLSTNLALLAGLLVTAGLPPQPWTGILVPVGLALLFAVMTADAHPGRIAWFFALAHQATLLHWLFLLDPSKSIPTRALVPIQAAATILYVACFYLLAGWVFGRLRDRLGPARGLLLLPVLWLGLEALRSRGEMAFSWCLTGAAVIGTPLMGLARAGGEAGVGLGLAFLAALAAFLWLGRKDSRFTVKTRRLLLGGTALVWAFLLVGSALRPAGPTQAADSVDSLEVAAVQADVALAVKWVDAMIDSTRIPYEQLTRVAAGEGAEFVVWAETAVPAYLRYDKDLLAWARAVVTEEKVWLYTGFPDADRNADGKVLTYNSSGLFSPRGQIVDKYSKYHLLPIGESMPFTSLFPFLAKVDVGQAEWTPGRPPLPMTLTTPAGTFRFSGLICFESIFSRLARQSVREGSQCLVVITNDGWFGKSAGPRQHALLARLRSVECGVPVIRCANNGISFICDDRGRLQDSLGLGRRGIVRAAVRPGQGRTLYVALGSWPLGGFSILWLLAVLLMGRGGSGAAKKAGP